MQVKSKKKKKKSELGIGAALLSKKTGGTDEAELIPVINNNYSFIL